MRIARVDVHKTNSPGVVVSKSDVPRLSVLIAGHSPASAPGVKRAPLLAVEKEITPAHKGEGYNYV